MATVNAVPKTAMQKFLDGVEKVGNMVPHPVIIFLILIGIVIVLSALMGGVLGTAISFERINPETHEIEQASVGIRSLLNAEGIRFMYVACAQLHGLYRRGAIAGNLRTVALSTTVTLLVPVDRRDKANGLVGTVNGVSFALTSVFSGLAIGFLGMGWSVLISVVMTAIAGLHLLTIRVAEQQPEQPNGKLPLIDLRGAVTAVRLVPGLVGLILFTTLNNLLGGVFMALVDPYGLTLVSVQVWGILLAVMSSGFIVGGLVVARKGLGARPLRLLLLINVAMWSITALFPVRSSIVLLTIGFTLFMCLIPAAEAAEQTILQKVVPFTEQGRVFGFAQTIETLAAPVTAFLIGPIAQFWVIPSMTDGAGADLIGSWFGTGPDRGMALLFIASGLLGVVITLLAFRTRSYDRLSAAYGTPQPSVTEAS